MKETLNPNEWIVMNALWEKHPMTLCETIEQIGTRAQWNYKTYQSYLKVLEQKGYVKAEKRGRDKWYEPIVSREACVEKESKSLLGKLESQSVKLLMVNMVRDADLSDEAYKELIATMEELVKREERL